MPCDNYIYYQAELATILKAMKKIEEKTCIRFHRINPEAGKDWLLLMRTGRNELVEGRLQSTCYVDYINQNLKNEEFGDLGKVRKYGEMTLTLDLYFNPFHKVFDMPWNPNNCFGGAFTWGLGMGYRKIAYLVASMTTISNSDSSVGLFQHELLHNLGVGHTQKRHGNTISYF